MPGGIEIPHHFESYATLRIVWFGEGTKLTVNADGTPETFADGDSEAFQDLFGFVKGTLNGGHELATNGESDIASASWNKDTESPAGVLSLQLYPRKPYHTMISLEDVLLVYGRADKTSPEVFLALISVDSVHESRVASGSGATVVRISVQGRDLGKLLMETPTVYDAAFGGLVMREFFSQFVQAFTIGAAQGGPSLVVQTLLAKFFSIQQNFVTRADGQRFLSYEQPNINRASLNASPLKMWSFPGDSSRSLFSFLDTSMFVQTPMVGALLAQATLLHDAANLWSLCEMYSNRVVNEFFIDTRDLVPGYDTSTKRMAHFAKKFLARYGDDSTSQIADAQTLSDAMSLSVAAQSDFEPIEAESRGSVIALVHRQLPYDTYSFYSLPTTVIYETEVFSNDTGTGSHDILNMFRMRFPGLVEPIPQDLQFGVVINRRSIEKHGLRRYEGESVYPWTNVKQATEEGRAIIKSFIPTFEFYRSLVTTWHAYNERLLSGNMTMRFRPDVRVGTRLTFVKSVNGYLHVTDYYVQRVQHTYSPNAGQSRTTVDLVRGVQRDGLSVEPYQESHLLWSDEGGSLNPNPYEVVQSQDLFTASTNANVPATDVGE
jgi:hypothetical protein